jgi:lipoate-protein ligase A
MAFDGWLFERIKTGAYPVSAVLRLYSWSSEALTIGYNQKTDRIIDRSLMDKSLPIIRRITGGRAIYHEKTEIAFTLVADLNIVPAEFRTLPKTNQLISECLVEILARLGIESVWAGESDGKFGNRTGKTVPACFSSHSRFEILSGSEKIAGGAQRRSGRFFIHQGSIKLNGVSACPAIGQEKITFCRLQGKRAALNTIDQMIDPFEDIFGKKFSVLFRRTRLSGEMRNKIETYSDSQLEVSTI